MMKDKENYSSSFKTSDSEDLCETSVFRKYVLNTVYIMEVI